MFFKKRNFRVHLTRFPYYSLFYPQLAPLHRRTPYNPLGGGSGPEITWHGLINPQSAAQFFKHMPVQEIHRNPPPPPVQTAWPPKKSVWAERKIIIKKKFSDPLNPRCSGLSLCMILGARIHHISTIVPSLTNTYGFIFNWTYSLYDSCGIIHILSTFIHISHQFSHSDFIQTSIYHILFMYIRLLLLINLFSRIVQLTLPYF